MRALLYLLGGSFLWAQSSLWQDHNPYISSVAVGDILEIVVDETFVADIDANWERKQVLEAKIYPDTKNFPFLPQSEQSKTRSNNNKVRYKLKDNLKFRLAGIVGEKRGKLFTLEASRNLRVDGKPVSLNLKALFDPRHVKNGQIRTSQLAELSITVQTEPPVPRDTRINLKPPRAEGETPPPVNSAELSEQEKQQYLLRHLQEILGHWGQ
ncbi:MAG: flagellar basal body L-ring protein FlgH [Leptospiraceae bacterium]|nr:flagellar basal body L-ring protein FlgH [Leptospiraceae bacterium]MDW8307590.1 flagellar basal body L-ring protein FlgH [Leptospiraceae bacterium]